MAKFEDLAPRAAEAESARVLTLVGVNHRSASLAELEDAALDEAGMRRAFAAISADPRIAEGAVISTCNRTEIYLVTREQEGAAATLGRSILLSVAEIGDDSIYVKFGRDASAHLCRLAAGIDSLMVGEVQILGQVKQALLFAAEQHVAGPILGKLFATAFRAGKRARNETRISEGAVSLSYAALGLAQKIFSDLSECAVLVVGAGEAGTLAARHFAEAGAGSLIIANRSPEPAAKLSAQVGGRPAPLDELGEMLALADIVVTAAASQAPLVTRELAASAKARRGNRSLVFIDIAMPRNVDPRVNQLEGVFVHDMSALESMVAKNLERRRREIPRVEAIVAEEVDRHDRWERSLGAGSTIRDLRERFEAIRRRTIADWRGKVAPDELELIDQATQATIKRLLHVPTIRIRSPREEAGDPVTLLAAVRELFALDEEDGSTRENRSDAKHPRQGPRPRS